MLYTFSERISTLQPSTIREMLKASGDPETVPFAAGNPSTECFPVREMAERSAELFAKSAAQALQYGITEGFPPLRELTAERLKTRHRAGRAQDSLLITSGGQQGIELTAKVLCNERDTVVCEAPSFIGALNAFRSYNLNLVGVPMDGQGMDVDALEEVLRTRKNVRLIYTIPTFQNPTGATMPLARRRKMLELAERYNVMILEDSPYLELRYSGEEVPTIKSLDETGRVIYVGSYSKIIAPGIRVGFVCAPEEIAAKMTVAKQVSDVHTNLFFQMLTASFIEHYDLDAHIARCVALYRTKRDTLAAALRESLSDRVDMVIPEGGLFLWGALKGERDSLAFCQRAKERRAMVVPGVTFSPDEHIPSNGFRMNFSLPTVEQLERGARLLGEALA